MLISVLEIFLFGVGGPKADAGLLVAMGGAAELKYRKVETQRFVKNERVTRCSTTMRL